MTFKVAGLAVPGCEGPSKQWSRVQHTLFCREISYVASYARDEGGGSQKVTNDDEGGGGGHDTPQK